MFSWVPGSSTASAARSCETMYSMASKKLACSTISCCSVTKSCPTLCDPMDCSMPGFPVLHYLSVCSNSCPLSQWCHPTISSSVISLSSCPQSFLASGSFPMSRLFASGGQSIEAPASESVLPVNIQGWFPLGLTGFISLQSQRLSSIFSHTSLLNYNFIWCFWHQIFGTLPICLMIKHHLTPMAQGIRGLVFPGNGGGLPGMCVGGAEGICTRHKYQEGRFLV